LLLASHATAQIGAEGTVRGVVSDTDGGVLPGVTVTATSATSPQTYGSLTEADGQYRLLNLPPGRFNIAAELQGFAKFAREGVEVRAGLNLTVDIVLSLGSVEETITVTGEPPLPETQKPRRRTSSGSVRVRTAGLAPQRDCIRRGPTP
jgi:hypothetical protein